MSIDPDINDIGRILQHLRDKIAILQARVIALEQNVEGRLASLESANADKL